MDMDKDIDKDKDMDTIFCLSSNRNKPKLNVFWFCFSFFHKNCKIFWVCFGVSELFQNEPKQKIKVWIQTETENYVTDMATFLLFWFVLNCLWVSVISKRRNKLFW